ncbi:MAG: hypothetical protein KUG77_09235 [Nannocystaceae bacterium]|nr:hypothetical protein [Nannocystaceae bacterium]
MAWLMRYACFILGCVFGLVGCSTGTTTARTQDPAPSAVLYHHYTQAAVLQHRIMNRPPLELLDASGEALVLDLARAQNCLASRTGDLALAEKTQTLLVAYIELHLDNGSAPSRAFHRRARHATIDAEATQQGTTSAYFLGCSMRPPMLRNPPGRSQPRQGRAQQDYYGTGLPWNQRARSVPGGVIR